MILATDDMFDFTKTIPDGVWNYIEKLLDTSVFDEMQRTYYLLSIRDMEEAQIESVITYLRNNQLEPVTHRGNHSATEINRFIKKICNED